MEIVRSDREVWEEIKELKSLRSKVQKYNNAGDPNREIIDAEIHFLKHGTWIHKDSWFYTPFSKTNVIDWLTCKDEIEPSSLWDLI